MNSSLSSGQTSAEKPEAADVSPSEVVRVAALLEASEMNRENCARWDGENCWSAIEGQLCTCPLATETLEDVVREAVNETIEDLMSEWAGYVEIGRRLAK